MFCPHFVRITLEGIFYDRELFSNNISGIIPEDLGNLMNLVSLDLYSNALTGAIPTTLGKLTKLRFLRLNNNSLTGQIPMSLTAIDTLRVLNLSDNRLEGDIPINGSFSLFNPTSFSNNQLNYPPPAPPPPNSQSTASTSSGLVSLHFMLIVFSFATVLVLIVIDIHDPGVARIFIIYPTLLLAVAGNVAIVAGAGVVLLFSATSSFL